MESGRRTQCQHLKKLSLTSFYSQCKIYLTFHVRRTMETTTNWQNQCQCPDWRGGPLVLAKFLLYIVLFFVIKGNKVALKRRFPEKRVNSSISKLLIRVMMKEGLLACMLFFRGEFLFNFLVLF